jgi:pimeloyl-ACP methyl ester carboxylesterase
LAGFCNDYDANLTYDTNLYIDLVNQLMKKEKLSRIDIAGNSLGGAIALKMAAVHPQKVRRLFAIDSAGLDLPEVECIMHEVSLGENIFEIYNKSDFEKSLRRVFHKRPPVVKPLYDFFYWDYRSKSHRSEKIMTDLHREFSGYTSEYKEQLLRSITAETKIIWGESDSLFPLRLGKYLAQIIPHAQLEILDKTGHVPHVESPYKLTKAILRH